VNGKKTKAKISQADPDQSFLELKYFIRKNPIRVENYQ